MPHVCEHKLQGDHGPKPPSMGHSSFIHIFPSSEFPSQSNPPISGSGLSQNLILETVPVPQEIEQILHGDHGPQFPATGQGLILQSSVSSLLPWQNSPSFCGIGALHSLFLETIPSPQVLEHEFHGDQGPQFPFTGQKSIRHA